MDPLLTISFETFEYYLFDTVKYILMAAHFVLSLKSKFQHKDFYFVADFHIMVLLLLINYMVNVARIQRLYPRRILCITFAHTFIHQWQQKPCKSSKACIFQHIQQLTLTTRPLFPWTTAGAKTNDLSTSSSAARKRCLICLSTGLDPVICFRVYMQICGTHVDRRRWGGGACPYWTTDGRLSFL